MHKLNLIEGIPGSGKTTMSKLLYQTLKNEGIKVKHFNEGSSHPADLSWQSILDDNKYKELLLKYPEYVNQIKTNTVIEDGLAITAYTLLDIDRNSDLYKYLQAHEIYSINADLKTFKQAHLLRWKKFVKNADKNTVYIFECVLLQNHITQLMLEYQVSEKQIESYINEFLDIVKSMSPIIHYLAPKSVELAIRHVAEQRRPENQDRKSIWIDRVIEDVSKTPYGIKYDVKNIEGFIDFTSKRQTIEKNILKNLNSEINVIEHKGSEWKEVLDRIKISIGLLNKN